MDNQPLVDKRMFLGSTPLFESLSEDDLGLLIENAEEVAYAANRVVMAQGEPGENMYILIAGSVQVSLHLADNEDLVLGKLSLGEAFGEIALFDQQARTATVTTCEPSKFLCINRSDFHQFLRAQPHVAIQLLCTFSKRLRATSDLLKDTMYSNVSHRLAETLCNIGHAYGQQSRQGLHVDIDFDDKELARIAQIPVQVASAQLQQWCNKGIIRRERQTLTIIKLDELVAKQ